MAAVKIRNAYEVPGKYTARSKPVMTIPGGGAVGGGVPNVTSRQPEIFY